MKAARDERRLANQTHRRAVKEGDSGEVEKAWEVYLTSKHKLQDLIRSKITEADRRTLKEIRDSGKAAAEKFWRYVNSMDRNDPPPTVIEDHTGNAVQDLAEHLSEYLTKAFEWEDGNTPVADLIRVPSMADTDPVETEQPGSLEQTITPKWEVVKAALDRAIAHIKNNTAQGTDGILATLLKCMGDGARRQLASILTDIIAGSPIPEDWMHSRIVLVPKRGGNKKRLNDYRPLTVTSVIYRVFAHVIKEWMCGWVEANAKLTELQNGFRRDRRLQDNLFVLTQLIEIARKEGRDFICCFLDVAKAYDSVPHGSLIQCLIRLDMPSQWTNLV